MEAVPRLPMLSFELKHSPEATAFDQLKKHIHDNPETYSKECHSLEKLRSHAMRPTLDVEGCTVLKRYYWQLNSLENRFPNLSERGDILSFSWADIHNQDISRSGDIKHEMGNILYNIGCLHTMLGAAEPRTKPESMKSACTHFQCAAWSFNHLKENYPKLLVGDMFPEMLIFMEQLCFAQAQECILENSLAGNRKAANITKVAAQIITFYNSALAALMGGLEEGKLAEWLENKTFKKWKRYVKFKIPYLSCILFLYQGQTSEEQQNMGERVTLYQAAFDKLEEAKKASKDLNASIMSEVNESLTFTMEVVEAKRKSAKSENEFIYHEEIPLISTIAAIKGATLVKGIPFNVTDPVYGEDIFKSFVPMKAHEASSMYSEEKAEFLRRIGTKVEDKDIELKTFMSSLNVDFFTIDQSTKLPQDLVDRCASLNAKPNAIPDLVSSMSSLADSCFEVESMLQEIKELLSEEEMREKKYQQSMGSRPSGHFSELNREFQKYLEAHSKAGESNETLRKAMGLHVANLKTLSQPLNDIQAQVPVCKEKFEGESLKQLEHLLNKVSEMGKQRMQIYEQLREDVIKDDITIQIVANGDNPLDELFKKELSKHDQSIAVIEQNLTAQSNILSALTDCYAKCAPIIKSIFDSKHKREHFFSSLAASYDVYEDLLGKSVKGLEFYKKLQGNVQKLFARVKGARDVQDEERQQRLKSSKPVEVPVAVPQGPKLKDYLKSGNISKYSSVTAPITFDPSNLPNIRPNPVGSETTTASSSSDKFNPQSSYQSYNPPPAYTSTYSYGTNYPAPNEVPQQQQPQQQLQPQQYYPSSYNSDQQSGYTNPIYQNQFYQPNSATQTAPTYQTPISTVEQQTNYPPPAYQVQEQPSTAYHQQQPIEQNTYQPPPPYQQYSDQTQYYQPNVPSSPVPSAVSDVSSHSWNQSTAGLIQQMGNMNVQDSANNSQQYYPNNGQYMTNYDQTGQLTTGYGNLPDPNTSYNSQTSSYSSHPGYSFNQATGVYQYASGYQFDGNNSQQPNNFAQYSSAGVCGTNSTQSDVQQPMHQVYQQPQHSQQQYQEPQQTQQYQDPQQTSQQPQQQQQYQEPQQQPTAVIQTPLPPKPDEGSYYTLPYGYHSSSLLSSTQTTDTTTADSPSNTIINSNVTAFYANNLNTGYNCANNSDNQNQNMTYMHSKSNMSTSTTVSQSGSSGISSYYQNQQQPETAQPQIPVITPAAPQITPQPVNSSNMDLLSGIDFTPTNIPVALTLTPTVIADKIPEKLSEPILEPKTIQVAENDRINDFVVACKPSPALSFDRKASYDNLSICSDLSSLDQNFDWESASIKNDAVSVVSDSGNCDNVMGKFKDAFDDPKILNWFHKEVQRLEKFLEGMNIKTLNGTTPLDGKWNELQDLLVKDETKRTTIVAKLFPEKNRTPDCIPYDHARVLLPTTTDDYINAVYVRELGPDCPTFILSQTPLQNTVKDFWSMIWSQKSKTVVCLHTPNEILDPFWPQEINKEVTFGEFDVTLLRQFDLSNSTELNVKVVMHGSDAILNLSIIQIKTWNKASTSNILAIAQNIITAYRQQLQETKQNSTVIMNCLTGSERSGVMALAIAAILASQSRRPILINVTDVWFRICSQRKAALRDIAVLQLSLQIVLSHAHDLLNKRGILTSYQMKNDQIKTAAEKEEIKDPFSDLDPLWKLKQK